MDLIAGAGPSRRAYRMLLALLGLGAGIGLAFLIASLLGASPAGAAPSSAPAGAPVVAGQFTSVPAARLVNTATGTGGHTGPLRPRQTRTVQITGHGHVPATAKAVNVTLTATGGSSASGRLTVFPAGTTRPAIPSLYFGKGRPPR